MSSSSEDPITMKGFDWSAHKYLGDLSTVIVSLVLGAAVAILVVVYFTSKSKWRTANGSKTSSTESNDAKGPVEVDLIVPQQRNLLSEDFSDHLEDIAEELERCKAEPTHDENFIRRIKLARQKAINKKIQETLTVSDIKMEKIMESQQLAKIFSLLRDNEDKFGKMSVDDVKSQMSMYKE